MMEVMEQVRKPGGVVSGVIYGRQGFKSSAAKSAYALRFHCNACPHKFRDVQELLDHWKWQYPRELVMRGAEKKLETGDDRQPEVGRHNSSTSIPIGIRSIDRCPNHLHVQGRVIVVLRKYDVESR